MYIEKVPPKQALSRLAIRSALCSNSGVARPFGRKFLLFLASSAAVLILPGAYFLTGETRLPEAEPTGVRVHFNAQFPPSTPIAAEFAPKDLLFQPGEPFTVTLRVKNRSHRELWAKVAHKVEPEVMAKHLGLVDCGAFVPFRLRPKEQQENTSTYLVWTDIPQDLKRFSIIYEFEVDRD